MSWMRWGRAACLLSATLVPVPSHAVAPAPPTSVQVVERTPTSALIRWVPSPDPTKGFKVRNSDTPGVHPDPTLYPGGKLAAFTWTTDDGYDMNLVYDQIFTARGLHFSAFLNSASIGNANKMTWSDVRFLYAQGHEIGNHDRDHASLIDDRAIALRYTGVEPCDAQVFGDNLRTYVDG
ncbi:hypothetical protein K8I85_04105, partial [bacterium]|nr:hypothetical protein [bacterium]